MKIEDVLPRELVLIDVPSCDRKTCLTKMVHRIRRMYTRLDANALTRNLMEREKLGSTAMGGGIAVPHVYNTQFKQVILAVGRCPEGVHFEDAPDAEPIRAIFLLILPEGKPDLHLTFLARLGRLMDRQDFMGRFLDAPDRENLYDEIVEMDEGAPPGVSGRGYANPA